jgi:hypothetical protein
MAHAITIDRAIRHLTHALRGVDPTHGIEHSLEVLNHVNAAFDCFKPEMSRNDELCVLLATLSHDADDRKYVNTVDYANARAMMRAIGQEENEELVIKMISLVSCSSNGNRVDPDLPVWMYYPRWADRICGMNVPRLIAGALLKNKPIFIGDGQDPETHHVTHIFDDREELLEAIDPQDFEYYSTPGHPSCGKLVSVVDHCYTVLLNIPTETGNSYFNEKFATEKEKVAMFCLTFAGQERTVEYYRKIENGEL